MQWRGKKVLVMGLGLLGGGVGTARYFLERDADVTITDLRDESTLQSSLEQLNPFSFRGVFGRHEDSDFTNADLVVRNPGVPNSSPYLAIAKKAGIPIETEAGLFLIHTNAFIIGVTGTKGKTTIAHFIAEILRAHGVPRFLTGTPGTSFLHTLGEIEDLNHSVVVAEFSSWDLESIAPHRKSPEIAVMTNVFPDHLNRHGTLQNYLDAKTILFQFQKKEDVLLLPKNETALRKRTHDRVSRVHFIGHEEIQQVPTLHIPGQHVRVNAALAIGAAQEAMQHSAWPFTDNRFSLGRALEAVAGFRGLPGRLEDVGFCQNRRFINDTAATNPGATQAAIDAVLGPVVLIAGGEDKGLSYKALSRHIAERVKYAVLFSGSASEKLESDLREHGFLAISSRADSMRDAVHLAFRQSVPGDTILLSPAAASFNLFKNEFDRGTQFGEVVKKFCVSNEIRQHRSYDNTWKESSS